MADRNNCQEASPKPAAPPGKHVHVRPNALDYTDGLGVKHKMCIPRGKYDEVIKLYVDKNWEALAKFPAWTGAADQQYREEDYFTPADEEDKGT